MQTSIMKFRRNRVVVASLFLVWIGGMYFFLIGQHHRSFKPEKSRDEYVLRGRKVRFKPNKQVLDNNSKSKFGKDSSNEQDVDTRKISDLDASKYIEASKLKPDEDPYGRNAYNQKESEKLAMDREVPDVRDAKYVYS